MATKNDQPLSEQERQAAEMATPETPATDDVVTAGGDPPPAPADEPVVETPAAEPPEKVETARERVARRYSEKRQEEIEGTAGTIYDVAAAEAPPVVTKPTDDAAPAPIDSPAAPAAEEPVLKLKVHGREIELPQSEVIKQAQINIATSAGERALADLSRQISDRRNELASLSKPAPQPTATNGDGRPTPTPADRAPDKPTTLDPARLAEIAEDIRNGTDEDASKALLSLVTEITAAVKPAASAQPVDVTKAVSSVLAQEREIAAVDADMDKFRTDYKDVITAENADDLLLLVYQRVVGGMLDDMEKAGASASVIANLRDADPITVAIKSHRLRNFTNPDGTKPYFDRVRDRSVLLRDAGEHVRSKYLRQSPQPTPQPGNGNGLAGRTDLKRTLTPQPRTTQHRTQAEAVTPAGGKPDSKATVSRIASLRNRGRSMVV